MAKETTRKLLVKWNNSETQQDQVDALEKKTIKNEPANVIRKNAEIVIADSIVVTQSERFVVSYTFENLPEWSIPHFRPKYFFTTENGYDFDETFFYPSIQHIWIQEGINYIFSFSMFASLIFDYTEIPLFFTASLIFDNPRIFNELQFNKS